MKRRQKKNKRLTELSTKTTVALIVIVLLIGIGGTMIAYTFYNIVFVKTFPIEFEVSELSHIGFNADANLDFGKIPTGGSSAKKFMNLFNDYDFPVNVQITIEGDVAPYIQLEDNLFVLEPGEYRKLWVMVKVRKDEPLSNHTGEAMVVYRRV